MNYSTFSLVLYLAAAMAQFGDADVQTVLENIEAWERAYQNIEVVLLEKYVDFETLQRMKEGHLLKASIPFTPYARLQQRVRYVGQGSLFRLDVEGSALLETGSERTLDEIRAFDGEYTKILGQRSIGNVVHGPKRGRVIRPHTLFFYTGIGPRRRLSEFLRGEGRSTDLQIRLAFKGTDRLGTLDCYVIEAVAAFRDTGTVHDRLVIWVVPERDYIPAKYLWFLARWSSELANSEGKVLEWTEIEPGYWFPKRAVVVKYNPFVLKRERRQQVSWQREYIVEKVSLNPKYPLSFFQDVEFPEGTPVYEIVDGEIVRSWVQGRERAGAGAGAAGRSWLAPLALAALTLIGLAVGAVWYLSRRRSAA